MPRYLMIIMSCTLQSFDCSDGAVRPTPVEFCTVRRSYESVAKQNMQSLNHALNQLVSITIRMQSVKVILFINPKAAVQCN